MRVLRAVMRICMQWCACCRSHELPMTELYPLQVFAIHVFSAGSVPNRLRTHVIRGALPSACCLGQLALCASCVCCMQRATAAVHSPAPPKNPQAPQGQQQLHSFPAFNLSNRRIPDSPSATFWGRRVPAYPSATFWSQRVLPLLQRPLGPTCPCLTCACAACACDGCVSAAVHSPGPPKKSPGPPQGQQQTHSHLPCLRAVRVPASPSVRVPA